jgi:hypothetical protein
MSGSRHSGKTRRGADGLTTVKRPLPAPFLIEQSPELHRALKLE